MSEKEVTSVGKVSHYHVAKPLPSSSNIFYDLLTILRTCCPQSAVLQFFKIRGGEVTSICAVQFCRYFFFYKKPERSVYKCTEAGINSHITVPSKVCASQVFTKLLKRVKFSSDQKIVREGFFRAR